MPSNSGGACTPISSVMTAPQSPPCATNLRVAEALHQHDPGTRDVGGVPPGRGRLAGKPVAGHRRNHDMERVGCISAVCGGIGQRIDDLHLFGDRAGPSVRNDERQRIFVFRTDVNEMNVQSVDLGEELRQGRSVSPRTCASRNRSPNSAPAPASSRAVLLGMHL